MIELNECKIETPLSKHCELVMDISGPNPRRRTITPVKKEAKNWTDRDIRILTVGVEKGHTLREIAADLNKKFSVESVRLKIQRLELQK